MAEAFRLARRASSPIFIGGLSFLLPCVRKLGLSGAPVVHGEKRKNRHSGEWRSQGRRERAQHAVPLLDLKLGLSFSILVMWMQISLQGKTWKAGGYDLWRLRWVWAC